MIRKAYRNVGMTALLVLTFFVCIMIQTDSVFAKEISVILPNGGSVFIVDAEAVSAEATEWGKAGTETWLYVDEDIDNSGKDIVVHGDVKLILGDNTTYRCRSLALDGSSSNITFYCESYGDGMGAFIADNSSGSVDAAAIGTNLDVNRLGGNITIYGGNIQAINYGDFNAALGCGTGVENTWTAMGTITINGGNITATTEQKDDFSGPAIGAAWQGSIGKIIINGGNIDANTTGSMAAIGGSCSSYSGFGYGTIELNGGNITAYTAGSGSDSIKAIGGYQSEWTITSVQDGKTVPINSCYWYMTGGSSRSDAADIHELSNNHYVKMSKKSEAMHAFMERYPLVQPEFDEAGTLVKAGCKAYFKCACGNYYEDNAECKYIGKTEDELNAWKESAGKLEEKHLANYLSYENGEMKAKSRDAYYTLSYDGASILGTVGTTSWYYVDENVEFKHNIEVRGDVRIILADGVTAMFYNGLNMYKNSSSLTIYAQSEGNSMGKLIAGGCSDSGAACIGGFGTSGTKIRIDGGDITAENKGTRVGIGDGNYPEGNPSITINGGKIKARGYGGTAIGFDSADHKYSNRSCTVTINGGTIDAVAYDGNAAAIGSAGCYQTGVTINGGNITALSNGSGCAIGCSPVGWYECTPVIRCCLFDTVAGESAETAEKCDYTKQRYVKMTRLADPVTHRLKKEYPMWAPRFNGDNTLAEAGLREHYQCMCGYYYTDSDLTKRIADLSKWKEDSSINGGKLDHVIIAGEEPTCSAPGYKEYYAKGKLYFSDEACTQSIDNLRSWKSKGGDGYIAPQGHVFTEYSAEGNVLTGICSQPDCELTDHKATLTLKGDEFEYDGEPKSPEIVNAGWTGEIPEITYEGTGEIEWSGTEAPSEIGSYVAHIKTGDATASQEFTIVENATITELLKKLDEAKARYEAAESKVTELDGKLKQAENEYSRMVSDYEQKLTAKAKEIADLETALKNAKEKCDAADAKVLELEAELQQAKTEYNQMVNSYEQQLAAKTETIEGLKSDLEKAQKEKADAEKRAEEAEAKLGLYLVDSKLFDIKVSVIGKSLKALDLSEFVIGGTAPYTFTAEGLPQGITISEAGVLSGKFEAATPAGTATITVTDAMGDAYSIEIECAQIYEKCHVWGDGNNGIGDDVELIKKATLKQRGSVRKHCIVEGCSGSKKVTLYRASKIKLATKTFAYTGEAIVPEVIVKDYKGKVISEENYDLVWGEDLVTPGKKTVKVVLKHWYSGTKKLTYSVVLKKPAIASLTAKSQGLDVKWKPVAGKIDGFELRYSTSSKMRNSKKVVIGDPTALSHEITELKGSKRYYVQVRSYVMIGDETKYSSWSTKKYKKTLR